MTTQLCVALATALLVTGCMQSARELPPDMSKFAQEDRLRPGDRDDPIFTLQCSDINQAIVDAKNERLQHEAKIAETRVRNQVVIFPVLVFPPAVPLALLADPHSTEHEAITKLEERLERLDRIRTAKRCEAP